MDGDFNASLTFALMIQIMLYRILNKLIHLFYISLGMLKGSDKGFFYIENFLRGLLHLSKKMSCTGGVKIIDYVKLDSNIACEPNLWMISEEHPLPKHVEPGSLGYVALKDINACTLDEGPKARLPVLQSGNKLRSKRWPPAPPVAPMGNESQAPSSSISGESSEGTKIKNRAKFKLLSLWYFSTIQYNTMTANAVVMGESSFILGQFFVDIRSPISQL